MNQHEILLLTGQEIAELMDFGDYVDAVEKAFIQSVKEKVAIPAVVDVPASGGAFHIKSAALLVPRHYVAVKINGNFPENNRRFGLPTIQGIIVLCDGENGAVLALMDSIEITINRTGAATALAARHLARKEARVATICGCGIQGRIQLIALLHCLALEKVFAFDLNEAAATAFAGELTRQTDIAVTPVSRLSEATRQSDVIVTCTPSRQPFLRLEDVREGTLICAVGADSHDKQELDPRLLRHSRVVTDVTEQCANIGELHHAIREGLLERGDVAAELGEIIAGLKPGRLSSAEMIVFDSTGTALQDVAAAAVVYERARRQGTGRHWRLNGLNDPA